MLCRNIQCPFNGNFSSTQPVNYGDGNWVIRYAFHVECQSFIVQSILPEDTGLTKPETKVIISFNFLRCTYSSKWLFPSKCGYASVVNFLRKECNYMPTYEGKLHAWLSRITILYVPSVSGCVGYCYTIYLCQHTNCSKNGTWNTHKVSYCQCLVELI